MVTAPVKDRATTLSVESKKLRDITTHLGQKQAALRTCLYQALYEAVAAATSNTELRVLDIGCGRGELLRILNEQGHTPVGVDLEQDCVELSRQYAQAELGGFDELAAMFPKRSFDVIVSSHVIEHVDNPLECLRQALALEADRYVIAVPNVLRCARLLRALVSSNRGDHPTHVFGWGRPEFQALLERAGLELIRWHCDRVTFNPVPGNLGASITRILSRFETGFLPKLFPGLSSSLIAECRPRSTCSPELPT